MKVLISGLVTVLILNSVSALAASSNADCVRDAKKVSHALLLVNHPDMSKFAVTTHVQPHHEANDPNDSMIIDINYWAPQEDEYAVMTYSVVALPSGAAKCGGIVSVTEESN